MGILMPSFFFTGHPDKSGKMNNETPPGETPPKSPIEGAVGGTQIADDPGLPPATGGKMSNPTAPLGAVQKSVQRIQTRAQKQAQEEAFYGTPAGQYALQKRSTFRSEGAKRELNPKGKYPAAESDEDEVQSSRTSGGQTSSTAGQVDSREDLADTIRFEKEGSTQIVEEKQKPVRAAEAFPVAGLIAREVIAMARQQERDQPSQVSAEEALEAEVLSTSRTAQEIEQRMNEAAHLRARPAQEAEFATKADFANLMNQLGSMLTRIDARLESLTEGQASLGMRVAQLETSGGSRDTTPRSLNGGVIGEGPPRAIAYHGDEPVRTSSPSNMEVALRGPNTISTQSDRILSREIEDATHTYGPRATSAKILIFAAKEPASKPFERTAEVERWLRQIELLTSPPTDTSRIRMARVTCTGRADMVINGPTMDNVVTWREFKDLALKTFCGKVDASVFSALRAEMKIQVPNESPLDFLDRVRAFTYPMKQAMPETLGGVEVATLQIFMDGLAPHALKKEVMFDDHLDAETLAMKAHRVWKSLATQRAIADSRVNYGPRGSTQKPLQNRNNNRGASHAVLSEQDGDEEVQAYPISGGNNYGRGGQGGRGGRACGALRWCSIHMSIWHDESECKDPNPQCQYCKKYGHIWRACPEIPPDHLLFQTGGRGPAQPPSGPQSGNYPGGPPPGGRSGNPSRNQGRVSAAHVVSHDD